MSWSTHGFFINRKIANIINKQPNSKLLRSWLISEILHRYNSIVDRQHIAIDNIIMPQ